MPAPPLTIRTTRLLTGEPGAPTGPGTVSIAGGRIAEVRPGLHPAPPGDTLFDAGDLVVMPGAIDAHVHVNEPGRTEWEGFATAGRAAAAGGTTTIVVMPLNCSPVATTAAALHAEVQAAAGVCAVDHGFWGGLIPGNLAHLAPLWDAGALGFKCFMVHSGIDDFPHSDDATLDAAIPLLRDLAPHTGGAPLLAHAEDPGPIAAARGPSGLDAAPRSYAAYLASRPPEAETRAIDRLITLCERHRSRAHIVHVAAAQALPLLAAARARGVRITAETCPHYLAFAAETIPDGRTVFKCAPPIRSRANNDALWAALRAGTLDLVASDHSPCPPELKHLGTGDFAAGWGGITSLQLTLPVLWTQASSRGHTLTDIARWLCSAPARLAGIHAFKGRLAPGFDADITIWNPDQPFTVSAAALQHRHKPTPYDGLALRGVVHATLLRGTPVFAAPHVALPGARTPDGFNPHASGQWVKRTQGPPSPT